MQEHDTNQGGLVHPGTSVTDQDQPPAATPKTGHPHVQPHAVLRHRICIFCFSPCKTNQSILSTKNKTLLSLLTQIEGVDVNSPSCAAGFCDTCRLSKSISESIKSKHISKQQLSKHNFSFHVPSPEDSECFCFLCNTYYDFPRKKAKKTPQKENRSALCSTCKNTFFIGQSHKCPPLPHSRTKKFDNLLELFNSSPKMAQQITSHFLKNFVPSPNTNSIHLSQFPSGPNLSVHLGPPPKIQPKIQVSVDELLAFENSKNSSYFGHNSTMKFATWLNKKFGKKTVIQNFQKIYQEKTHLLSPDTVSCFLDLYFENKKKKKFEWKKRPAVLVHYLSDFVLKIIKLHHWDITKCLIQYNVDKGDEQIKFLVNILHKQQGDGEETTTIQATGWFLVGLIFKGQENHTNAKIVEEKIGVHRVEMRRSEDHKMINTHCGLSTQSASFPCAFCEAHKNKLDQEGKTRTIRSLEENYEKFNSGAYPSKDCFSVIAPHLLSNDPQDLDKPVSNFFFPSELHLLLVVNSLIQFLKKCFPEENPWFNSWLKSALGPSGVRPYHGGTLEGNQIAALLNSVDDLRTLANKKFLPLASEFVEIFHHFKLLKDSCFGTILDPTYPTHFANLQKSIVHLKNIAGYSPPFRFHNIFFHTKPFIDQHKIPLGSVTEQGAEQFHSKFRKFFSNYPSKDCQHPNFLYLYKLSFDRINGLTLAMSLQKWLDIE